VPPEQTPEQAAWDAVRQLVQERVDALARKVHERHLDLDCLRAVVAVHRRHGTPHPSDYGGGDPPARVEAHLAELRAALATHTLALALLDQAGPPPAGYVVRATPEEPAE
jgi:hypothetical protein